MIWKYISKLAEYEEMDHRYYEILKDLEAGVEALEEENKKLKEKRNEK